MEGLIIVNKSFITAIACIAFNPFFWNVIGALEYHTHSFSKLFCNHKKLSIAILGAMISSLMILRAIAFELAIQDQPTYLFPNVLSFYIGRLVFIIGNILTLSSFWQLGFFATYLGDHFGVFTHDAPIKSFPYNISDNPMYWGSTITHIGVSLSYNSPAGLLLTAILAIAYKLAIMRESKMLNLIYSKKSN